MVTIVPAVALGLLFMFFIGAAATFAVFWVFDEIAKRRKRNPTRYRDDWQRDDPDRLTDKGKEKIAIINGVVAVVLVIFIMIAVPREWTAIIWSALTVIGILVGISTFFLFGSESTSPIKMKARQPDTQEKQESKWAKTKYQTEHHARVSDTQNDQTELEKDHQKHRAEYQARVFETQKKQTELNAIKNDLYHLFGMPDDQHPQRARMIGEIFNRFFITNDIPIHQTLRRVNQADAEMTEYTEGAIEIDARLFLVGVMWRKESIGASQVSPYVIRVFSHGYAGGILIANTPYSQPAITACQETLFERTLILCELAEIVTLLERNCNLKDFLKAKIIAAIEDKIPLFKPLC